MEPAIGPGSLLVVKPVDPASLKKGDVIVFNDPTDPVSYTHLDVYKRQGLPDAYRTTKRLRYGA